MLGEDDALKMLNEKGTLYIYGAGTVAKKAAKEIVACNVSIEAFLVSDLKDNASVVDGIPVINVSDAGITGDDLIIIGVSSKYRDEVHMEIELHNISCNIMEDYTVFLKELGKFRLMSHIDDCCQEDSTYKVERDRGYVGIKQVNRAGNVCHFRVRADELAEGWADGLDGFRINFLDLFEQVYGSYNTLSSLKISKQKDASTLKILMACCHKDKQIINHISEDYIVPIQVGKRLTSTAICEVTDDTGIHISEKNGNYCECTALYWAWKNQWKTDSDYVGLCHYRRRIDISADERNSLKDNAVDIVLTAPTFILNIKKHFARCTKNPQDWDIMKEAVNNVQPNYAETFEIFEKQHMVCQCNISIMRRNIFDEYCEFLFDVLEYVENYYNKIESRNDRYLGYLAENLLSVFAIKHKGEYKIAYGDMLVMD